MRLFRSIANAQNGKIFYNMGAAFEINDELAAQVVRYFLPPLYKAMLKRMETPGGLMMLLELIGSRRHDRYLADPGIFTDPQIEAEGQSLLTTLIPNRNYIAKIIENRAQVLPVSPKNIEKMLPYITILVFGAVELKTRQPLKKVVLKINGDSGDGDSIDNPFTALANEIRERKMAKGFEEEKRKSLTSVINILFRRTDERRAA
ncbi:MAG: hypothetical protein KTR19_01535 [Hyphomicrobiales bacterium]|nr:hypothetical protein [Hyphomicrobiales bacterium]